MITPDGVVQEFPIRFLVFAGDGYYPAGGALDLKSMHEFINYAEDSAQELYSFWEWVHIYDIELKRIIYTIDFNGYIVRNY